MIGANWKDLKCFNDVHAWKDLHANGKPERLEMLWENWKDLKCINDVDDWKDWHAGGKLERCACRGKN